MTEARFDRGGDNGIQIVFKRLVSKICANIDEFHAFKCLESDKGGDLSHPSRGPIRRKDSSLSHQAVLAGIGPDNRLIARYYMAYS